MSAEAGTIERTKVKFKRPKKWNVIIHNDNITPMNYVVAILQEVFGHSEETATDIMLQVHMSEKGIAGTYMREIAETKIGHVQKANSEMGYSLKVTMQEE